MAANSPGDANKKEFLNEIIILAGGLGTRLREEVPDMPKCMAPVAGRPFLFHVINYFRSQGVTRFIFSLGYKHEIIEEWLLVQFPTLDYDVVIENEPMGTGGAIALAAKKAMAQQVLVANGDTLFKVNISRLIKKHLESHSACTLALKPMKEFDRYGVVEITDKGSIKAFSEKKYYRAGFINGGVYALDTSSFLAENIGAKFSFEKDYLEKLFADRKFSAVIDEGFFIDIGIPEDYHRAQQELERRPLDLHSIDKSWTLFIDRDGVINHEKKEEYIRTWSEFRFYEGVIDALRIAAAKFGRVIIISNQRGVGRGLMTEADLMDIHQHLQQEVTDAGGRIDAIYYCIEVDNKHMCRKPNPGMAFRAASDFPAIDLSHSIMVGNKPSDMLFGRYAGIYTVFVKTTNPEQVLPHPDIDLAFDSLADFAKAL